jgi:hypothetical protein
VDFCTFGGRVERGEWLGDMEIRVGFIKGMWMMADEMMNYLDR